MRAYATRLSCWLGLLLMGWVRMNLVTFVLVASLRNQCMLAISNVGSSSFLSAMFATYGFGVNPSQDF